MSTLPRKEREKLQHREEILCAAERVFAEKGYFQATMSEVARGAEFSVGNLYLHFSTKEELYQQLVTERMEALRRYVHEAMAHARGPQAKLEASIISQLEFFEKNKTFFKVLVNETRGFECQIKSALGEDILRRYEEHLQMLTGVFAEGQKKGLFINEDPGFLALALQGIINSFVAHWMQHEQRHSLVERVESIKNVFFGSVSRKR